MKSDCKILVPNATSPKNIGDAAMLSALKSLLREVYRAPEIVIHSSEPQLYDKDHQKVKQTLYSWAVFEKTDGWSRLVRTAWLLLASVGWRYRLDQLIPLPKELKGLIRDYQTADLIVYVGGGYLRSQPGMTQALNVIMMALLVWWGRWSRARTIVAPISFGPFAYHWQAQLAGQSLKQLDVISVREKLSYAALKPWVNKVILSADHALLLSPPPNLKTKKADSAFRVGFTIRKWLPVEQQTKFELEYLAALISFSQLKSVVFQPIVQVDAPKYGDQDAELASQIAAGLTAAGARVLPMMVNHSVTQAQRTYAQLDLLLGMRMHSNILAATVGVPFVAISYEYKTEGIAEALGLADFCLKVEEVTQPKLVAKLELAHRKHRWMVKQVRQAVQKIQAVERGRWQQILATET